MSETRIAATIVILLLLAIAAITLTAAHAADTPSTQTVVLPGHEFHCRNGYDPTNCQKDIARLKAILARYHIESPNHWRWVLVGSQEWKPISQNLGLNSPAFTSLTQQATFLEEALFTGDPIRSAELMQQWKLSMPELLDLAVTHELGHVACQDRSEAVADHFAEGLRRGRTPQCVVSRKSKQ